MLTTHSAWLLSSLVLGCNGLLSGSGSVIADLQAKTVQRRARRTISPKPDALNDRIYPTGAVFYAEPSVDMHNRMKEALVLLGKLPRAVVRPPLVKISDAEIARIGKRWSRRDCSARKRRRGATRREQSFPSSHTPTCGERSGVGGADPDAGPLRRR